MPFKVGDKFRDSLLSKTPGGCTVIVELHDGKGGPTVREYDKIKNPEKYIARVKKDPNVKNAYVKVEPKAEPDAPKEETPF